jgi:hypothetical protein
MRNMRSKVRLALHVIRDAYSKARHVLLVRTRNLHPLCFNFLKYNLARELR